MEYHDLDLVLVPTAGGGGYERLARCGSAHGQRRETVPLALDQVAHAARQLEGPGGEQAGAAAQREVGLALYDGLLGHGPVGAQLDRCIRDAREHAGGGVRIRLDLDGAPSLAAIPWEFLYLPGDQRFLAASRLTPVVRYLRDARPNLGLEVQLPVRVLVVLPENAARGDTPLDLAREKSVLQRALQPLVRADAAEVRFLERRATRARLRAALRGGVPELGEQPFQIVCYAGHGQHDDGQAFLFLDGEDGSPDGVSAEWLSALFEDGDDVKLVVLNACQGATVSELRPFAGLAPALVKAGVPAVVAMQYPVRDGEALTFAEAFYGCLFRGASRGRVEVALTEARRVLRQDFPESRAWGAPVLYMRTSGYLFTPTTGSTLAEIPVSRERAEGEREAEREHRRNIQSLRSAPDSERTRERLGRELRELANVRNRLRLRAVAAAVVLSVAAVVTALAAVLPFEALPPALNVEAYAGWLEGLTPGDPLDGRILRVPVTARTEAARGRGFDPTTIAAWRTDHAHVIDALSQGGAKVVGMAMYFSAPSDGDTALARAVRDARRRGTRVVFGFLEWNGDQPRTAPALLGTPAEWGALCVGVDGTGTSRILPLVSFGGAAPAETAVPAFATAVVAAFRGDRLAGVDTERGRVVFSDGAETRTLRFWRTETGQRTAACPALSARSTVASAIITHSPGRVFTSPRHLLPYEALLGPGGARTAARARGKIAIVGRETPSDVHQIFRLGHETRYGEQLQVDAVNSVLRGATLRPLEGWGQLLVAVLTGGVGAAIDLLLSRGRRGWWRAAVLPAAAALYLACAVATAAGLGLLLNVWSQLAALFLCFALVWLIRRRTGF